MRFEQDAQSSDLGIWWSAASFPSCFLLGDQPLLQHRLASQSMIVRASFQPVDNWDAIVDELVRTGGLVLAKVST